MTKKPYNMNKSKSLKVKIFNNLYYSFKSDNRFYIPNFFKQEVVFSRYKLMKLSQMSLNKSFIL